MMNGDDGDDKCRKFAESYKTDGGGVNERRFFRHVWTERRSWRFTDKSGIVRRRRKRTAAAQFLPPLTSENGT